MVHCISANRCVSKSECHFLPVKSDRTVQPLYNVSRYIVQLHGYNAVTPLIPVLVTQ